MSTGLTVEQFNAVIPRKMRSIQNKEFIDEVNKVITDPIIAEHVRDNILGWATVLEDGKFKLSDYMNAVMYVSFKIQGDSNQVAWTKTFPDRYQRLVDKGTSPKDISAYVAAFNKTKLVTLLLKQTLVPTHILNADLYQEAINEQAMLMRSAKSEMVRQQAGATLIKELAPPEATDINLNVKHEQGSVISELQAATAELVAQQKAQIQSGGMSAQDVAHSKIVKEGEVIDVEAERVDD